MIFACLKTSNELQSQREALTKDTQILLQPFNQKMDKMYGGLPLQLTKVRVFILHVHVNNRIKQQQQHGFQADVG